MFLRIYHNVIIAARMCTSSRASRAGAASMWAIATRRRTQAETWPAARDPLTRISQCSRRHTAEQSKWAEPRASNNLSLLST